MFIYRKILKYIRGKLYKGRKTKKHGGFVKGKFKCRNPSKYKGDPTNIIYRSSWEMVMMSKLDNDLNVVWWQSEEFYIPYVSPVDNKIHRYFVDFAYRVKDKNNRTKTILIEVKPKKETMLPQKPKRSSKGYITEAVKYSVNQAKWNAARQYCLNNGYEFQVITEDDLFGKKPSK